MASRKSNQLQVALNSIVKAQDLENAPSYEVSQEFANVLWLHKEQKLAVQFLRDLQNKTSGFGSEPTVEKALSMARLVSIAVSVSLPLVTPGEGIVDIGGVYGEAN